jgi:hypothetical protein
VVTRSDLPVGTQACQATHAALDFALAHPDVVAGWHHSSNVLVLLAVPDEPSLHRLADRVATDGLRAVAFREPDLDGGLTAVALEPAAWRHVSRLPLALRTREEVNGDD